MPLFEYKAVDLEGRAVEGTMDGLSARRVTEMLQERELQVNSVKEVGRRPGLLQRLRPHLNWEDIDLLNEQLAAITRSGLPIAPSLKALGQDISNRRLKPVLEDIHGQLESGSSLEAAFGRHPAPASFPPIYRSMLRAGERTGNLSGVLSHLCTYSARMLEVKNGIQEAIAYPILVIMATCLVVGFLMAKVIPTFASTFEEFGAVLPALTQFVVDISVFFVRHGVAVLVWTGAGLIVLTLGFKSLHRSEGGGYALDWLKIHMPVFGKLFRAASMARFSQSLGLLLASNVPVLESLDLAAASAGNAVLREAVRDAARRIEGGESMSAAFESSGGFGHSFCWMIATAEERGEVDGALLNLADSFERSIGRTQRFILTFIGPAVIILIGFIVATIVIAMYLPIFMLGDAINQP